MALGNGSAGIQNWLRNPVPIYFKVYVFNITNPDEVQMGEKAKLKEVGPFIYVIIKERIHLKYMPDNTIKYYESNYYTYAPGEGNTNEDAPLVLLNTAVLGSALMVEKIFPFGLSLLNKALPFMFPNMTDIFIRTTAREFFFGGIKIHCNHSSGPAFPVCSALGRKLPSTIVSIPNTNDYSFAMFRHKNSTLSGPVRVKTGTENLSDVGKIVEYNGKKYLNYWDKNTSCSKLRGTDSTIFPPAENREEVYIYVPDICLSLFAEYEKKLIIDGGMTAYKFVGSKQNFNSPNETADNVCRCPRDDHKKPICLKKGAFEVTECQGIPVIVSNPHFMDADPEYLNYIDGLRPSKEDHETFIILEPMTGAPIKGRKRLQLNMQLKKIKDIEMLANVTNGVFPILWVEEGADIHLEGIQKLKQAYDVIKVYNAIKWSAIALGLVFILAGFTMLAKLKGYFCFQNNHISADFNLTQNRRLQQEYGDKTSRLDVLKTIDVGELAQSDPNGLNKNKNDTER